MSAGAEELREARDAWRYSSLIGVAECLRRTSRCVSLKGWGEDAVRDVFRQQPVPQDFQNGAFMRQLVTFKLSDQYRVERDSQLIFSGPGVAIETEHIDQVLENFSAFVQARAHLANSENVHL
jgi:hypothetical protein